MDSDHFNADTDSPNGVITLQLFLNPFLGIQIILIFKADRDPLKM